MYMMHSAAELFCSRAPLLLYRDNHSVAASLDQKGRLVAGGWQGLAGTSDTVYIQDFG